MAQSAAIFSPHSQTNKCIHTLWATGTVEVITNPPMPCLHTPTSVDTRLYSFFKTSYSLTPKLWNERTSCWKYNHVRFPDKHSHQHTHLHTHKLAISVSPLPLTLSLWPWESAASGCCWDFCVGGWRADEKKNAWLSITQISSLYPSIRPADKWDKSFPLYWQMAVKFSWVHL